MLCAERANVSTNVAHETNVNSALQIETSSCRTPLQSPHLHHHVMHVLTDSAEHFGTFRKDRRTLRAPHRRSRAPRRNSCPAHTHMRRKRDPLTCTSFFVHSDSMNIAMRDHVLDATSSLAHTQLDVTCREHLRRLGRFRRRAERTPCTAINVRTTTSNWLLR